jgi:hypothetical protein
MLFIELSAKSEDSFAKKNIWLDGAIIYGVTFSYLRLNQSLWQRFTAEYSFHRAMTNLLNPIDSAIQGAAIDQGQWLRNYLIHPGLYAGLGLYGKARGYSNLETLIITSTHAIFWEYGIQGGMGYPSGKDLIMDTIGSVAAVYLFDPLSRTGETHIANGKRSFSSYILLALNPFRLLKKLIFPANKTGKLVTIYPQFSQKRQSVSISYVF